MNHRFEELPNEIFLEIFKNLPVGDLFRAFYNLNTRFNRILESISHCLVIDTVRSHPIDQNEIFLPYVTTVIVRNGADTTLNHLVNVRRGVLYYSFNYLQTDFQVNLPPNIECISVRSAHHSLFHFSDNFIRKIFSAGFPHLKSCCFPSITFLFDTEGWTQSPSLRILTVGFIQSHVYAAILACCPNLYSLGFKKYPQDRSAVHVKSHVNLKRMKVYLILDDCLHEDSLNSYFESVPHLERLTIFLMLRESYGLRSIKDFDWFASMIACYLPMLRQFDFHVIIDPAAQLDESEVGHLLNQYEKRFQQIHGDRYQSKIVFQFQDAFH